MSRKLIAVILILATILAGAATAQETYFGKNKVRYKDFDWNFIQTRHFDIHFYEDVYPNATFAAAVLESAYVEISGEFNYKIQHRVPIFIYNSHNDFQQTNIISSLLPEGVGGFTEAFKNRVVIPVNGSYEDFRHVLHHELVHAIVFDMLYGRSLSSLISRQRLFNVPLWLSEGMAEYSSRHGWDYQADMFVRDATINGYLAPPGFIGGFLAYKQGQAMTKYIADKYGQNKLTNIFKKGKALLSLDRAMKEAIGIDIEDFWKDFSKEMKRRYWPDIALRMEPDEIAKPLTESRKDGSYYNDKPTYSPDGDRLAIFTDKSDYTEIVMISALDGKVIARLVDSERSGDLESLHSYVSGMSFSPDGKKMVFIAKSKGKEALFFFDVKKSDVYLKKRMDFHNIASPAWSPDGNKVAFSALSGYHRDLFIYDIDADTAVQITNDRFDDVEPSWYPESDRLAFSSDRAHPQSYMNDSTEHLYVASGAYRPGDFNYGFYNIFDIDLADRKIAPIDFGAGPNKIPRVSPDGSKIAFISNRNGIDNIYIGYIDSSLYYPVTDLLTGAQSISWSPDGAKIAFSAFNKGGFDVFILKDIVPQGENGQLSPTDYVLGKYDLLEDPSEEISESKEAIATTDSLSDGDELAEEYSTYAVEPEQDESKDSTMAVADSTQQETGSTAGLTDDNQEDDETQIETGIHDDEYVFVSETKDQPYEEYLVDMDFDDTVSVVSIMEEPAHFDSITVPLPGEEYEIKKYRVRFTPDYVGGGFAYDTFFGIRGQTYFVFSDYLGNHQLILATDLVNTIDQSNIQAYYFYNRNRTNIGIGLFHTKNFYEDNNNFLFSDRFYGFQVFANRPSSKYSRVQFMASQSFIDRNYLDFFDTRENRSTKASTAELAWVKDNIVWGITGPVNGTRYQVATSAGIDFFDTKDLEYTAAEFDYRHYWHFKKTYSMALRFSGGASFGRTPKLYFLGGTTNWIGQRTLDASVYEVENLYFADVVTPLRGIPYYELAGNRYGLINWELRFPMIDYFVMRMPLPIVLSRVTGAIFTDIGAAWFDDDFKGATSQGGARLLDIKSGFGFGMRANLGFLVLRYDLAWSTDFNSVSDKPSYYFSFGADF